jgi:hypothetical protein
MSGGCQVLGCVGVSNTRKGCKNAETIGMLAAQAGFTVSDKTCNASSTAPDVGR